jgi:N-acetylglucosamine-6-sulfatase
VNYKAVRTARWLYVEYESGARELYDAWRDPAQLDSLHADPRYEGIRLNLERALRALQDCAGAGCRIPVI